jgi:hypothetical protein
MKRSEFLKYLIRLGLFAILALIVFTLGKRIVLRKDCSGCPGNGVCNGKSDCSKY